jgi:hypothetical protein
MTASARLACVFLTAIALTGCGPSKSTVSGRVTLDGQPVAGAIVGFFPTRGDGQTSDARTDADGNYKATISPTDMSITVSLPRLVKDMPPARRPAGMSGDEWAESLPARYSSRAKTELRVTAKRGGHVVTDLSLSAPAQ